MVLFPDELRVTRSLGKTLRNTVDEVRFDTAFDDGDARLRRAAPGQGGTWIGAEMRTAYRRLHELGYAHSVETWIDGELAGGLYGVAIGAAFFGESMFSRSRDASKIALVRLVRRLAADELPADRLPDAHDPPRLLRRSGNSPRGVRPPGQGLGRLPAASRAMAREGAGIDAGTTCRN